MVSHRASCRNARAPPANGGAAQGLPASLGWPDLRRFVLCEGVVDLQRPLAAARVRSHAPPLPRSLGPAGFEPATNRLCKHPAVSRGLGLSLHPRGVGRRPVSTHARDAVRRTRRSGATEQWHTVRTLRAASLLGSGSAWAFRPVAFPDFDDLLARRRRRADPARGRLAARRRPRRAAVAAGGPLSRLL